MGNSASSAEHAGVTLGVTPGVQQLVSMAGHSKGEQAGTAQHDASNVPGGRRAAPRVRVDIRGSELEDDYVIHLRRQPRLDKEAEWRSAWSGLQAVGGLLVTVLTVQKLWEDILFIRLLRRELSSLVSSLASSGTDNAEAGGARPPRSLPGASSRRPSTPPPTASHVDIDISDLSSRLNKTRRGGRAATQASASGASSSPLGLLRHQQDTAGAKGASAEQQDVSWASISGLTEVKIILQEAAVLPTLRPDLFQGIRLPPKALLLFGPPGTGKTMLARAVAAESRAAFLPVTGSSILSMWYGQSEQNVKALFEKARRKQPSIIFIDEVDSLLGKRSSVGPRESTPDKRVTNEFLAFIDGIQTQQSGDTRIMVIAATNSPWDLDEAALSRFARRIYVPLPDKASREALMRKTLMGLTCDIRDEEWQRLSERCDKYSGRDLMQVCREAAMRPLRELWGRRLLEGSAPAAPANAREASRHADAQERLVQLVEKSLAAVAEASGHSGTTRHGPDSASGLGGGNMQRWRLFGFGVGDRYARSKQQARRELERWKRRHRATWCNTDEVVQQADRRVQARRKMAAAAAVGHVTAEAGADGPTTEEPSGNSSVADMNGEACEQDSVSGASALLSQGRQPLAAAASGGEVAFVGSAEPCAGAVESAAGASAAPAPVNIHGGAGEAVPPVRSLGDLLALPTVRVRPIVAADVEAALRVTSCTEMDQSARYNEWDQQYGSGVAGGANVGGRNSVWMSMYV